MMKGLSSVSDTKWLSCSASLFSGGEDLYKIHYNKRSECDIKISTTSKMNLYCVFVQSNPLSTYPII